jgi:hypothetical protein
VNSRKTIFKYTKINNNLKTKNTKLNLKLLCTRFNKIKIFKKKPIKGGIPLIIKNPIKKTIRVDLSKNLLKS